MTTSPYTVAVSRIPLDASGVWLPTPKGAALTNGTVTLNVVDGALRGITVAQPGTGKAVLRVNGEALRGVALSFGSKRDKATLAGFVR
jgi:hypothetical protein